MSRKGSKRGKEGGAKHPSAASVLGASGSLMAFKGEQVLNMVVPGTPFLVTSGVLGQVNSLYPISPASIGDFATRFANTWNSYRILAVDFEIMALADVGGSCYFYFDNRASPLVPTATLATEATSRLLQNNIKAPRGYCTMRWVAKELEDLEFRDCGAPQTVAALAAYRDNANNGTTAISTGLFIVRPRYQLQLKTLFS